MDCARRKTDKYSRLLKNTGLIFAGNIGTKLLQFLMLPFYTRHLSTVEYGKIDIITAYTTIVIGLAVCSIYDSVFLFPKGKTCEEQKIYFSSAFLFCVASLTICGLLCFLLSLLHPESENVLWKYLWIIYLLIVLTAFQSLLQQFCRGVDAMVTYVLSGVFLSIVTVTLGIVTIPHYGLNGYLFSHITGILSGIFFAAIGVKIYRFFSIHAFSRQHLKEMLAFSIPLVPATIMWWVIVSSNRLFIEGYSGLASVGIFALANRFPVFLQMLYSIFGNAWQISAVEEFSTASYEIYYNRVFDFLLLVLVTGSALLAIFSQWIIDCFAAESYYESWCYIPVLALAVVLENTSGFVGTNFTAAKESRFFMYAAFITIVVGIIFNILLIPKFGLPGAAVAVLFTAGIQLAIRCIYAEKFARLRHVWKKLSILFCNLAICFTSCLIIQPPLRYILSFLLLFLLWAAMWREIRLLLRNLWSMVCGNGAKMAPL